MKKNLPIKTNKLRLDTETVRTVTNAALTNVVAGQLPAGSEGCGSSRSHPLGC